MSEKIDIRINNEILLECIRTSMRQSLKEENDENQYHLETLLCCVMTSIKKLKQEQKERLFDFSKACAYTFPHLCDILEYSELFFDSYLFSLEKEELEKTCNMMVHSKNLWDLFISSPNTFKALVSHFGNDDNLDNMASKLLSLHYCIVILDS